MQKRFFPSPGVAHISISRPPPKEEGGREIQKLRMMAVGLGTHVVTADQFHVTYNQTSTVVVNFHCFTMITVPKLTSLYVLYVRSSMRQNLLLHAGTCRSSTVPSIGIWYKSGLAASISSSGWLYLEDEWMAGFFLLHNIFSLVGGGGGGGEGEREKISIHSCVYIQPVFPCYTFRIVM